MRDVSSADSKHGDSASVSESASSPVYRVAGQDSLGQSISGRGHADEPRLCAGAPFFASSSFVCAGPALGNARIPHHLPWLLTLSHLLRRVVCSQLYSAAPELLPLRSGTLRRCLEGRLRVAVAPRRLLPDGVFRRAFCDLERVTVRDPVGYCT